MTDVPCDFSCQLLGSISSLAQFSLYALVGAIVFTFAAFSITSIVYVLTGAALQSRQEDDEKAFQLSAVAAPVLVAFTAFLNFIVLQITNAYNFALRVANSVAQNFGRYLLFTAIFALALIGGSYHNYFLSVFSGLYNCNGLFRLVNSFLVLIFNSVAFVWSGIAPVYNAVPFIFRTINAAWIETAVKCGDEPIEQALQAVTAVANSSVIAVVDWAFAPNSSVITDPIDFVNTGADIGRLLATTGSFFSCSCALLAMPTTRFFRVFNESNAFARSFSATANMPVVFTQDLIAPAVALPNAVNQAAAGNFSFDVWATLEPNFNRTYDNLISATRDTALFADELLQANYETFINGVYGGFSDLGIYVPNPFDENRTSLVTKPNRAPPIVQCIGHYAVLAFEGFKRALNIVTGSLFRPLELYLDFDGQYQLYLSDPLFVYDFVNKVQEAAQNTNLEVQRLSTAPSTDKVSQISSVFRLFTRFILPTPSGRYTRDSILLCLCEIIDFFSTWNSYLAVETAVFDASQPNSPVISPPSTCIVNVNVTPSDSCYLAGGQPGCADLVCCINVCSVPGYGGCCTDAWNQTCVDRTLTFDPSEGSGNSTTPPPPFEACFLPRTPLQVPIAVAEWGYQLFSNICCIFNTLLRFLFAFFEAAFRFLIGTIYGFFLALVYGRDQLVFARLPAGETIPQDVVYFGGCYLRGGLPPSEALPLPPLDNQTRPTPLLDPASLQCQEPLLYLETGLLRYARFMWGSRSLPAFAGTVTNQFRDVLSIVGDAVQCLNDFVAYQIPVLRPLNCALANTWLLYQETLLTVWQPIIFVEQIVSQAVLVFVYDPNQLVRALDFFYFDWQIEVWLNQLEKTTACWGNGIRALDPLNTCQAGDNEIGQAGRPSSIFCCLGDFIDGVGETLVDLLVLVGKLLVAARDYGLGNQPTEPVSLTLSQISQQLQAASRLFSDFQCLSLYPATFIPAQCPFTSQLTWIDLFFSLTSIIVRVFVFLFQLTINIIAFVFEVVVNFFFNVPLTNQQIADLYTELLYDTFVSIPRYLAITAGNFGVCIGWQELVDGATDFLLLIVQAKPIFNDYVLYIVDNGFMFLDGFVQCFNPSINDCSLLTQLLADLAMTFADLIQMLITDAIPALICTLNEFICFVEGVPLLTIPQLPVDQAVCQSLGLYSQCNPAANALSLVDYIYTPFGVASDLACLLTWEIPLGGGSPISFTAAFRFSIAVLYEALVLPGYAYDPPKRKNLALPCDNTYAGEDLGTFVDSLVCNAVFKTVGDIYQCIRDVPLIGGSLPAFPQQFAIGDFISCSLPAYSCVFPSKRKRSFDDDFDEVAAQMFWASTPTPFECSMRWANRDPWEALTFATTADQLVSSGERACAARTAFVRMAQTANVVPTDAPVGVLDTLAHTTHYVATALRDFDQNVSMPTFPKTHERLIEWGEYLRTFIDAVDAHVPIESHDFQNVDDVHLEPPTAPTGFQMPEATAIAVSHRAHRLLGSFHATSANARLPPNAYDARADRLGTRQRRAFLAYNTTIVTWKALRIFARLFTPSSLAQASAGIASLRHAPPSPPPPMSPEFRLYPHKIGAYHSNRVGLAFELARTLPWNQFQVFATNADNTTSLVNDTVLCASGALFEMFECDPNAQFCSDCSWLDLIVNRTDQYGIATNLYYNTKFPGFLTETAFRATTVAASTDTLATVDKQVPFILERLLDITWPWQINYTEFFDSLQPPARYLPPQCNSTFGSIPSLDCANTSNCLTETQVNLADGRENFNLLFLQLPLGNAIDIANSFVTSLAQTTDQGIAVTTTFLNRYVLCSQEGLTGPIFGLPAADPPGFNLFNGLVYASLVLIAFGVFTNYVPLCNLLFLLIGLFAIVFPLVQLFAYQVPLQCSVPLDVAIQPIVFSLNFLLARIGTQVSQLPNFLAAIPTPQLPVIAAPLVNDATQLYRELFPPCFPVPYALLDLDDPVANQVCTACSLSAEGRAFPRLDNCANATKGARFVDGFDNLLYMLQTIVPPDDDGNGVAEQLLQVSFIQNNPTLKSKVESFTYDMIATNPSAWSCNLLTFPSFIATTIIIGIVGPLAAAGAITFLRILWAFLPLFPTLAVATVVMWGQIINGFTTQFRRQSRAGTTKLKKD